MIQWFINRRAKKREEKTRKNRRGESFGQFQQRITQMSEAKDGAVSIQAGGNVNINTRASEPRTTRAPEREPTGSVEAMLYFDALQGSPSGSAYTDNSSRNHASESHSHTVHHHHDSSSSFDSSSSGSDSFGSGGSDSGGW